MPAVIPEGRIVVGEKVDRLTDALFSLDEPWQGRFLNLVANLATRWAWNGTRPTKEEITTWLGAELSLYQEVNMLLNAWWRPKR
jgi:hypothetical protein